MPRMKTKPSKVSGSRIPEPLQQQVIDLIATKKSDYANYTAFVIGAVTKEISFQEGKIKTYAHRLEGPPGSAPKS